MSLFNKTGLVAWYPMTEGSGTTLNDYQGTNNGTNTNSPSWLKLKTGQYALNFNGTNQRTDLGSSVSFTGNVSRTYNLWFRVSSYPGSYHTLICQSCPTCSDSFFNIMLGTTGLLGFHGCGSGNDFNAGVGTEASLNTWHMASVTHDGTTTKLWLDGVEVGSQVNARNTISANTYLAWHQRQNNYIACEISNVMIFNRALTSNEIKALYEKTYIE